MNFISAVLVSMRNRFPPRNPQPRSGRDRGRCRCGAGPATTGTACRCPSGRRWRRIYRQPRWLSFTSSATSGNFHSVVLPVLMSLFSMVSNAISVHQRVAIRGASDTVGRADAAVRHRLRDRVYSVKCAVSGSSRSAPRTVGAPDFTLAVVADRHRPLDRRHSLRRQEYVDLLGLRVRSARGRRAASRR